MPSPSDLRHLFSSRAEPEQRQKRKELEKEAAVGLTEVAVLGLIGLTLAWDIDKQVRKTEEKKEEQKHKELAERRIREQQENRRRGKSMHDRTPDSRRNHMSNGDNRRTERDDRNASRGHARDSRRCQSVDPRADTRYDDRHRDRTPRYDSRDYRRYDSPHDNMRNLDQAERGRSRRDLW